MKRTHLARTFLTFTLAWLVPLGCSEDPADDPMSPPPAGDLDYDPDVADAEVSGWVYEETNGATAGSELLLLSDPSLAPPGSEPAAGVPIEASNLVGDLVFSGATDGRGRFEFQLSSGYTSLAVDGGRLNREFTVVPGTTIDAGLEPPISAEEAAELVRSEYRPSDLVLRSLQPLPAGTVVYPSLHVSEGTTVPASEVLRLDRPSWFFYADQEHDAYFGHPVRYLLVDAEDGTLDSRNADWPPAINHLPIWTRAQEYVVFSGIDPDELDPEDDPGEGEVHPGPEVHQLPDDFFAGSGPSSHAPSRNPSSGNNADTFVIAVSGGGDSMFGYNNRNVDAWFRSKGVPADQIAIINLATYDASLPSQSEYKRIFEIFDQEIEDRLTQEERQSTLVLWVSSHSHVLENLITMQSYDRKTVGWGPGDFCLSESRACRLRIFLDTCYADRFAAELAPTLSEHDYRIAAATREYDLAKFYGIAQLVRSGLRPGGFFTNAVFDTGDFQGNDFTGLFGGSEGDILTGHPIFRVQRPQLRLRVQTPEWCEGPSVVGICCLDDGSCVPVASESECDGEFRRGVASCDPNPCPDVGACCFAEGACLNRTEDDCENAFGTFLGSNTICDPSANPCPGACCLPSGECLPLSVGDCDAVSGLFQGLGTPCTPEICIRPGACCLADGSCEVIEEILCDGVYQGDGTACDPNPCPQPGACCALDGECTFTLPSGCTANFLGGGTRCDPNPCPQPGACCFGEDGSCLFLLPVTCADREGSFRGAGTACDPNPCPQPPEGACCWGNSNERCAVRSAVRCSEELGGVYLGDGTTCFAEPCTDPLAGACCLESGRCEYLRQSSCNGDFMGVGVACAPGLCDEPEIGACCLDEGACQVVSPSSCDGAEGGYQGNGTDCDPNPCPQPGACCFPSGVCMVLDEGPCVGQGGLYLPDAACDPNPCEREGACCVRDDCSVTLEGLCDGEFQGVGSECDPDPCPEFGACCLQGACLVVESGTCDGDYIGDGSDCDPSPCPSYGACCLDDGSCTQTQSGGCDGDYEGDDTNCEPNPCPQLGACCSTGNCSVTLSSSCPGDFLGEGTTCEPDPCGYGACCVGESCTVVIEQACDGEFQGEETSCDPNPCEAPEGVCCVPDGTCVVLDPTECAERGGVYFVGVTCDPISPCHQTGACCDAAGSCRLVTSTCLGEYLGEGSVCDPNPCDQPGACCFPAGDCKVLPSWLCERGGGTFVVEGGECSVDPCQFYGACCTSTDCRLTQSFECDGAYLGDDTVCNPDETCPSGACCSVDGCEVVLAYQCDGFYLGDGTDCDPDPCVGACCLPDGCDLRNLADCAFHFGTHQGPGTVCDPDPCPVGATATVVLVSSGVDHFDFFSSLCGRYEIDGPGVTGAILVVEVTGPSNPGLEELIVGGDGSAGFDRDITSIGTYQWQAVSLQTRDSTYELKGDLSGEIVVTFEEELCDN